VPARRLERFKNRPALSRSDKTKSPNCQALFEKKRSFSYYQKRGAKRKATILKITTKAVIIQKIRIVFLFPKKFIYLYFSKKMIENKLKIFLCSKLCIFLLLLAFIWLGLVLTKTFYKRYQLNEEIENLKIEIEKMDKKEQELTKFISYLDSSTYLEKEAREKLNLKKEGESVLMVSESELENESSSVVSRQAFVGDNKGEIIENNLIKWWKFFFKK